MNAAINNLTVCLISLTVLSLSSCSAPPSPVSEQPASSNPTSPSPSTPAAIASTPAASPSPSIASTPSAARLSAPTTPQTTINVYKIDSLCKDLVPQKMTIAAKQSLEGAIAKVLEETDSGDFSIAGYRVSHGALQLLKLSTVRLIKHTVKLLIAAFIARWR